MFCGNEMLSDICAWASQLGIKLEACSTMPQRSMLVWRASLHLPMTPANLMQMPYSKCRPSSWQLCMDLLERCTLCRVEADMRDQAQMQQATTHENAVPMETGEDMGSGYAVEGTGAFVSINEAKARLMLFCDKLPADKYALRCRAFCKWMWNDPQPADLCHEAKRGDGQYAIELC